MGTVTTQDTTGDKGLVLFVPGLQGEFQIANSAGPDGTNQDLVRRVAEETQWGFEVTAYQTTSDPYPTLSEMQDRVAQRLSAHMTQHEKDKPLVIVASSVGAGVALGALLRTIQDRPRSLTSPYALLLYKPVIDPIATINEMYKDHNIETLGEVGKPPYLPLPIQGSESGDVFKLETRHFKDKEAVKLLSNPSDFFDFSRKADPVLTRVVACNDDPLTPFGLIQAFSATIKYRTVEQQWVAGDHSTDATDALQSGLRKMLAGMAYMR